MRMHFKGQSREREQKMWSLSFTPSFHFFCWMFLLRKKIGTKPGKRHLTRTGKGIRKWFKDLKEFWENRGDKLRLSQCLFVWSHFGSFQCVSLWKLYVVWQTTSISSSRRIIFDKAFLLFSAMSLKASPSKLVINQYHRLSQQRKTSQFSLTIVFHDFPSLKLHSWSFVATKIA